MEVLRGLQFIIEFLIWGYFAFAAIYILVFAIAGNFDTKAHPSFHSFKRRIAVLIPGYKEDAVIVEVAKKALEQDYPKEKFEVIVIADSFKLSTLEALNELPIRVVEVSFEKSTKAKALNQAMQVIGDQYDIAVVLDADNLMEYKFLSKVNYAFSQGFQVVQGHRIAKNLNTPFAILDAISEEINNHIFRKGHRTLGLSSALIGSGMAFDYDFFKFTMANVDAVGGFDKELELKLLYNRETIHYLEDAIVYDEKVQKAEVFSNQRKRWLSAQFIYFSRYAKKGFYQFFEGNIDFTDKVYQMVSPPRILLLGLTAVITLLYTTIQYVESTVMTLPAWWWQMILLATVTAFFLAIPRKFYNAATAKALLTLPKAFGVMFLSLFKLKGANKRFIHTQHGTVN